MDNSIGRAFAIRFFDKQTIGCQLINVRVIRRFWCAARFHLDGDDLFILLDEVIWFTCQLESGIKKWLLQFAPAARVCINNASAWESRGLSLAIGLPE